MRWWIWRLSRRNVADTSPRNNARYELLLPRDLLERLKAAAAERDRPVAWCVRRAVEKWLEEETLESCPSVRREEGRVLRCGWQKGHEGECEFL